MKQKEYDVFYDTELKGTVLGEGNYSIIDKRVELKLDYESNTYFIEVLNVTWLNDYKHLFI